MLKTKRNLSWLHLLLLLGLTVALTGCNLFGGDDDDDDPIAADPVQLARQGWIEFEIEDYASALLLFKEAISAGATSADAWKGAGWSAYRYDAPDDDNNDYATDAKDFWDTGLTKESGSKDAIEVGLAHYYNWDADDKDYNLAIEGFERVLARNSNFVFTHYELLTFESIWAELAWAYISLGIVDEIGETNDALDYIMLLDPTYVPENPINVNSLYEKIELIRDNMQPIR